LRPSDHLRMLVDLIDPVGAELSRRWLAALLLVPEGEREAVVEAVERRIALEYESRPSERSSEGESDEGGSGEP